MPSDESTLGECPDCGTDITVPWVVLEYEKDDGGTGIWAECPGCAEIVAPE